MLGLVAMLKMHLVMNLVLPVDLFQARRLDSANSAGLTVDHRDAGGHRVRQKRLELATTGHTLRKPGMLHRVEHATLYRGERGAVLPAPGSCHRLEFGMAVLFH